MMIRKLFCSLFFMGIPYVALADSSVTLQAFNNTTQTISIRGNDNYAYACTHAGSGYHYFGPLELIPGENCTLTNHSFGGIGFTNIAFSYQTPETTTSFIPSCPQGRVFRNTSITIQQESSMQAPYCRQ